MSLTPPPKLRLSRLRDIGWSYWDPIGLLHVGETWDKNPLANEYDDYLIYAAGQIRRGVDRSDVIKYLIDIESTHMDFGVREDAAARAEKVVEAIEADEMLWNYSD